MRHSWLLMCLALVPQLALAKPPPGPTDPALRNWFENLHQPGSQIPCCSIADCRLVDSDFHDGHYRAMIDGEQYLIPDRIISDRDNPTHKAVACYVRDPLSGRYLLLCFVPPPGPRTS